MASGQRMAPPIGRNFAPVSFHNVTNGFLRGTCQAQPDIAVMGAVTTDTSVTNIGAAIPAMCQTRIQYRAKVTASNTVTVYLCNPTTSEITPAPTKLNVRVVR